MEIGKRQVRAMPVEFKTRDEDNNLYLEGYFAVFDSNYEVGEGMSESIDPHAFDEALDDDIRCLTDHDTRLVLGRTRANTFEVSVDSHGLYGRAIINPNDVDAMNTKARVDRGDVNQASFGFDILDEEAEVQENGDVHWTIKRVKLYECSVVTFPAYKETNISARAEQKAEIMKRSQAAWKIKQLERLKGKEHGFNGVNVEEETD